jgi:hypothetical protein
MVGRPTNELASRNHLFISYASEDWVFADWLALKLASEGYRVWYDRLKLLGGESYPHDITEAIKDQTFRVIALLSRISISKPNPVKERTLALNIAKERKVDFLIPLNVDGLKSTELDFLTSDLVYIPFSKSWYDGFFALLRKLNQISTPKDEVLGRQAIAQSLSSEETPTKRTETQWSNLIPVIELPSVIRRFKVVPEVNVEAVVPNWPFYREDEETLLAFNPPEITYDWLTEVDAIEYQRQDRASIRDIRQVLGMILRKSIKDLCLSRGLKQEETNRIYFPPGLFPHNRLSFARYDGKKTNIQVVGERKFRTSFEGNLLVETSRYHLSPDFRFFADLLGDPKLRIQIGIFWTDLEGAALDSKVANRRRKALCKNWWNYEWLSRNMAVLQWLAHGHDEISLIKTVTGNLRIGFAPLTFSSQYGINEETLSPVQEEDENTIIEDSEDIQEEMTDASS